MMNHTVKNLLQGKNHECIANTSIKTDQTFSNLQHPKPTQFLTHPPCKQIASQAKETFSFFYQKNVFMITQFSLRVTYGTSSIKTRKREGEKICTHKSLTATHKNMA